MKHKKLMKEIMEEFRAISTTASWLAEESIGVEEYKAIESFLESKLTQVAEAAVEGVVKTEFLGDWAYWDYEKDRWVTPSEELQENIKNHFS